MTSPEIWRQFAHDPRAAEHAAMRASDADRDVVLHALGEAYADGRLDADELDERTTAVQRARTLGDLPGFLADLVPATAAPLGSGTVAPLVAADVEARAVARWQRSRREAFTMWLFVSTICWVVFLATSFPGHPWPIYPMLGTALPLLGTIVQRKDMIEQNRRKIVASHEKALAKAERRALQERQRREIEGRREEG